MGVGGYHEGIKMTSMNYAGSEAVLAGFLRETADYPTALVRTLHLAARFEHQERDLLFSNAINVVAGILTHPSQKSVEAQAAELVELIGVLEVDETLDYQNAREEALVSLTAIERVGAVLRSLNLQTRVPIRGILRSQRPLLIDYVEAYTAAVRAALEV